jgi:hypothetical protein
MARAFRLDGPTPPDEESHHTMLKLHESFLNRAPLCIVTHPLAGAALGVVAGALFGALCGGLHAAARGTPGLFLPWLLVATAAGAAAGLLMGVCTAVDRAVCRESWDLDEKRCRQVGPPADGDAARPHNRISVHYQSHNLVE